MPPKRSDKDQNKNRSSNRKGLLSVNGRRQALKLCLDFVIVVIVQIFDQFLIEVFH